MRKHAILTIEEQIADWASDHNPGSDQAHDVVARLAAGERDVVGDAVEELGYEARDLIAAAHCIHACVWGECGHPAATEIAGDWYCSSCAPVRRAELENETT